MALHGSVAADRQALATQLPAHDPYAEEVGEWLRQRVGCDNGSVLDEDASVSFVWVLSEACVTALTSFVLLPLPLSDRNEDVFTCCTPARPHRCLGERWTAGEGATGP